MDQSKVAFVHNARMVAGQFAQLAQKMADISEVYDHRQYGPGAGGAIVEADIAAGLNGEPICDPDDVYAFIIVCAQLKSFMNNQPVVQNDFKGMTNRLRSDM